ncbi:hypothetical protein FBUS_00521 [Fasciolopsis buskii]|uniref:Uncharacterized protein n=1 Tax=Fasciolopsis buskii TaxID=27845 RepID=A0A8E0S2E4_9TREM|nr:hypothetical protein FBUS_00521 [Fasciolopsis buski]
MKCSVSEDVYREKSSDSSEERPPKRISNSQAELSSPTDSTSTCLTPRTSDLNGEKEPESLITKLLASRGSGQFTPPDFTKFTSQATVPSSVVCRPVERLIETTGMGSPKDRQGLVDRLWGSKGPSVSIVDTNISTMPSRSLVLNTAPVIRTVDSSSYVTVRRQLSEAVVTSKN